MGTRLNRESRTNGRSYYIDKKKLLAELETKQDRKIQKIKLSLKRVNKKKQDGNDLETISC